MAELSPAEPIRPDEFATQRIGGPRIAVRCRGGHDQPNNPTWHAALGLVPALTSVVFAVLLIAALLALEAWLWPALVWWTLGLLGLALVVSGIVQALLGHRGRCWLWRTLRWWLGPIGTLVDPIEAG